MNDVTKRVKKYAEEEDADVEQPLGVASAAAKQIQNQWGSGNERGNTVVLRKEMKFHLMKMKF